MNLFQIRKSEFFRRKNGEHFLSFSVYNSCNKMIRDRIINERSVIEKLIKLPFGFPLFDLLKITLLSYTGF